MSRRSKQLGRRDRIDRPSSRAARNQRPAPRRTPRTDPIVAAGVVVIVLALVAGIFIAGGGLDSILGTGSSLPTLGPVDSLAAGDCPTSQPPALASDQTRTVTIDTSLGSIVIKVDGSLSPIAAGNFVALVSCGFYDGSTFHRTATLQDGTPFVIQGGSANGDGTGGPGYTIQDEPVTTTYKRGTVAMARTQQPNSQDSQFFIVLDDKDGPVLASANTYAIFGTVTSGMDVADAIYQASGGQEIPADPIVMDSVTVSSP